MKVKYYTTIAALAAFACAAQAEAATIYGSLDEADATEIKAVGENSAVELYPNDSAPQWKRSSRTTTTPCAL